MNPLEKVTTLEELLEQVRAEYPSVIAHDASEQDLVNIMRDVLIHVRENYIKHAYKLGAQAMKEKVEEKMPRRRGYMQAMGSKKDYDEHCGFEDCRTQTLESLDQAYKEVIKE